MPGWQELANNVRDLSLLCGYAEYSVLYTNMTTLTSRPGPIYLAVLGFSAIAAACLPFIPPIDGQGPPTAAAWLGFGGYWATLFGPLLVVVWWRRARIVAAEEGLRWRSWGGWRFVPWSGVVRCSFDIAARGQCTYIIETRRGTFRFTPFWRDGDELYSVIQTHAADRAA